MAILRGTEPVIALTRVLFIFLRSLYFFFLDFVSGDLALTGMFILTRPSDFHCFGKLELGRWPTLALMCASGPGRWAEITSIAIVEPRSRRLTDRQVSGFVYS